MFNLILVKLKMIIEFLKSDFCILSVYRNCSNDEENYIEVLNNKLECFWKYVKLKNSIEKDDCKTIIILKLD